MWVPEELRTLYHAGLAHGANHLVTLVTQAMELLGAAGADDPAATLRPLLTAALDNALAEGDAALTGPIVRGDVNTVRAHLAEIARHRARHAAVVRRPGPRHPRPGRDRRPGAADPRARPSGGSSTRRSRRHGGRTRHRPDAAAMSPSPRPRVARARSWPTPSRRVRRAGAPRRPRAHDGRPARRPRRLLRAARERGRCRGRWSSRSSSTRCSSAPGEDLDRYPRTFEADLVCEREGVDVVFAPSVDEVYPGGEPLVTVEPGPLGHRCSRARRGPATSAACSPWWPSCSGWSGPTSRCSARRTTSSWCWSGGWSRPVPGRRRRRRRDRPRARRARAVEPQPLPRPRAARSAPRCSRRALRAAQDARGVRAAGRALGGDARARRGARAGARPRLPRDPYAGPG